MLRASFLLGTRNHGECRDAYVGRQSEYKMKTIVGIVVLMVGGTVGIYFASSYVMGGIEGGMPRGGDGHFSDYHEDNAVTEFFGGRKESGGLATGFTAGDVNTNPFAD